MTCRTHPPQPRPWCPLSANVVHGCIVSTSSCLSHDSVVMSASPALSLLSQHSSTKSQTITKFITYNSLPLVSHPGYLRSFINYYTPATLYDQLTNFFLYLIVHGSPLNLAKDPSATLHPQSGMICLLIQDSPQHRYL